MGIKKLEVSIKTNKFNRQISRYKNKLKRSLRRMLLQKVMVLINRQLMMWFN